MKPKTCLENHPNCIAICCRCYSIKGNKDKIRMFKKRKGLAILPINVPKDIENYYNLHEDTKIHNNKLIILNPNAKIYDDHAVIFKKCKMLTKDNKCKLYNTKQRPQICNEGHTKNTTKVMYDTSCIFKPENQRGYKLCQNIKSKPPVKP